jgi:uncharacterized membrane protein
LGQFLYRLSLAAIGRRDRLSGLLGRFFRTPVFLIQTVMVVIWSFDNVVRLAHFDVYPFILLNLAFSLQAAYALR